MTAAMGNYISDNSVRAQYWGRVLQGLGSGNLENGLVPDAMVEVLLNPELGGIEVFEI